MGNVGMNPANFQIEILLQGSYGSLANNDVTTPGGLVAWQALIESLFTAMGGSTTTNTASYDVGTETFTFSAEGTGDNETVNLPGGITCDANQSQANAAVFRFAEPVVAPPGTPIACQNCYSATIGECEDFGIAVDLEPTEDYIVKIIDSFGDQIILEKTSDASGNIIVLASEIPDISLRATAPPFTVSFFKAATLEQHGFIIGDYQYDCLVIDTKAGAPSVAPDPLIANATAV